MYTSEDKLVKREYRAPQMECVKLDNEISLQLQSPIDPPAGPNETYIAPEYFNNDPLKMA